MGWGPKGAEQHPHSRQMGKMARWGQQHTHTSAPAGVGEVLLSCPGRPLLLCPVSPHAGQKAGHHTAAPSLATFLAGSLTSPHPASPASLWPTTPGPGSHGPGSPPAADILRGAARVVFILKHHSDPSTAQSPPWCLPRTRPTLTGHQTPMWGQLKAHSLGPQQLGAPCM